MIGLLCLLLVTGGSFLDSVFLRQSEIGARLRGVNFQSTLTYIETNLLNNHSETISCVRRVIMENYDDQQDVFITVLVNGQPVTGSRRKRVVQALIKKGVFARQSRLPFFPENRARYRYEEAGQIEIEGQPLRAIRFYPIRNSQQYITGTGYFHPVTGDLIRMEFVPADLPPVVDSTRLVLTYDQFNGFWLPAKFTMKMDLSLKVVKLLMRRRIEIEDRYSDYYLKLAEPLN